MKEFHPVECTFAYHQDTSATIALLEDVFPCWPSLWFVGVIAAEDY